MKASELILCARQIEKLSADQEHGDMKILLRDLEKSSITSELLEETDTVQVLFRVLRSSCCVDVRRMVKSLLCKWKRELRQQEGRRRSAETVSAQQENSGPEEQPSASSSEKEECLSPIRSKCVQLLLAALQPDPLDQNQAADLAAKIELHIQNLHKSSELKYKSCVRSKVANLRNPKNHLRHSLLTSCISPEAFARMTAEDMAAPELRQLREEFCSQGLNERQLPQGPEGSRTQKIRCKRCSGIDCRVTQVSRGALFLPSWVRPGGPDDDSMTYVTCSGCGQQWYHSSWVCL